jgi:hypothetical protein
MRNPPTDNRPIDRNATIALRATVDRPAVVRAVVVKAVVVRAVVVRTVAVRAAVDLATA